MLIALFVILIAGVVFRLGTRSSAAVVLGDPVVWVEDGARGRILQINGSTREIIGSVDVAEDQDESLTALPKGRDVVFLNRAVGEFGEIAAVTLEPSNRFEIDLQAGELEAARFLGGQSTVSGLHSAYIIGEDEVLVFSGGATEPVKIPVSSGLGDAVTDVDGRLIAVTSDGDQILASGPEGLVLLSNLPESRDAEPASIKLVRAGDSVYVIDESRRTVSELNTSNGRLSAATSICGAVVDAQLGGNVLTESDGEHQIIVHDGQSGSLSLAQPAQNSCSEISVGSEGGDFGPPVAVDNFAYLPNYATGQVIVVDLDEGEVVRTHPFTPVLGRAFELEVFDGVVWANEPLGARAAVISPDELVTISKQERVRVVGVGEEGAEAVGANSGNESVDDERVFGEVGDLFEGFASEGDTTVADDAALAAGDAGSAVTSDAGAVGDQPPDTEVLSGELSELVASPIILEAAELADAEALVANFSFSSDVLTAGETLRLTDESTGLPTQWNWDFDDGTGDVGPEVTKMWPQEGVYTVTMTISDALGNEASQSHEFTVVAPDVSLPPSANFTFPTDTIEVGEPLTFTSTSTGEPETLLWDFGDGTTSVGPTVTKTFTEPGSFQVTLTATNAEGSDSESSQITVVPGGTPPQAVIAPIPQSVVAGESLTLVSESTNSPTSTVWNFGDGTTDSGREVFHSWEEAGEYRLTLTVSNAAGEDSTFRTVVVEPAIDPPVARFNESGLEVIVGEQLSFTDQSLNNPTSVVWEFGDGATAQGPNVNATWLEVGQYTVTLTATNEAGTDSLSKTVTVVPVPVDPPVASFRVPSTSVRVGEAVRFTDTSTSDPTEWTWNFGDGAPAIDSTAQNPAHAFGAPGRYDVVLTATNAGGSSSFTRTVIVANPPVANFSSSVDELTARFTDASVNNPTSWLWSFGDGTQSREQNPAKTYGRAGTYTVTLVASNQAGDSNPVRNTITVAQVPSAAFDVSTSGLTATFNNQSGNFPSNFSWDFGDGVSADPRVSPTHTFASPGTYEVTLTASNVAGSDSTTRSVTVREAAPVARISCNTSIGSPTVSCNASGSSGAQSYTWSAPDAIDGTSNGGAGAGEFASFTFPRNGDGAYRITLTVENGSGDRDSEVFTARIELPVPVINSIEVAQNSNGTLRLRANASNSPTDWDWTVPNRGEIISGANGADPSITFSDAGSYTVSAVATNGNGTSASQSITVDVAFTPTVESVGQEETSPGRVRLNPGTTNNPTAWRWQVSGSNEGSSDVGRPTFTFGENGTYEGSLVVSNAGGESASFRFDVVVENVVDAPDVSVAATDGGQAVSALITVDPTNASVVWTVTGPGGFSQNGSGTTVAVPVTANGEYTVTATATANGEGTTASDTVNVTSVPDPAPTIAVVASANGQVVNAGIDVTPPGASVVWTVLGPNGFSQSGSGTSVSVTVSENGNYTVQAEVTANGQQATASDTATVTGVPGPAPTVSVSGVDGGGGTLNATVSVDPPSATVNWTVSGPNGFTQNGSGASINVAVPENGAYSVFVTATANNQTADASTTVSIGSVPPPPTTAAATTTAAPPDDPADDADAADAAGG